MERKGSSSLFQAIEQADCETGTLHDILADDRRRFVLARLYDSGKPMRLWTLAEEIAKAEREARDADAAPDVERIHQALYHNHIAKMANAGVVEYDRLRDTAELANTGYPFAPHLASQASGD